MQDAATRLTHPQNPALCDESLFLLRMDLLMNPCHQLVFAKIIPSLTPSKPPTQPGLRAWRTSPASGQRQTTASSQTS